MRVATIDIGTNSVLLLVADVSSSMLAPRCDHATITRLGQDVDATGVLSDQAVARTLSCLDGYAAIIEDQGADRVAAVATSAMRDARGGTEFLDRAEQIVGVRPEVISGRREAELTFDGAVTGLPLQGPVAVFDVGGGSTEVIVGTPGAPVASAVSLDVGAVRMTERHLSSDPPTAEHIAALRADLTSELSAAPPIADMPLVGVAGTVTTLAAIEARLTSYDARVVHGSKLSRPQLEALLRRLTSLDLSARKELKGLDPNRADVIVAGALIVDAICAHARADELIVSDRGVRYGLAHNLAL